MTVHHIAHERGAVAVIVAILLPALFGVAGLVIDGGELMLSRVRLQTAADASALAAAAFVGRSRSDRHRSGARAGGESLDSVAWPIAQRNWRTDAPLALTVESGRWDAAARRLAPTHDQPDAVAVRVRSTLPTRLAGALGLGHWTISAHSVAALPPLGSVPAGTISLPLGLVSLSTRSSLLNGRTTGRVQGSGPCPVRLSFESQGRSGTASHDRFPALQAGYSRVRVIGDGRALSREEIARLARQRIGGMLDEIITVVPVIEADRCPASPGWYRVAGFATVRLAVGRPNHASSPPITLTSFGDGRSSVTIQLVTGSVTQGRGSGPDFGTNASSPVLVQ